MKQWEGEFGGEETVMCISGDESRMGEREATAGVLLQTEGSDLEKQKEKLRSTVSLPVFLAGVASVFAGSHCILFLKTKLYNGD